jgi:hypothetical protein
MPLNYFQSVCYQQFQHNHEQKEREREKKTYLEFTFK